MFDGLKPGERVLDGVCIDRERRDAILTSGIGHGRDRRNLERWAGCSDGHAWQDGAAFILDLADDPLSVCVRRTTRRRQDYE